MIATTRVHHPRNARTVMKKLTQMYGSPKPPDQIEPVEQLILAILARNESPAKALAILQKIKSFYVDFNELRVTLRSELQKHFGDNFDQASTKAKDILAILKSIFDRENTFDLGFLKAQSKRELETYFADLETVDNYLLNSVILNCCGKQAFPLDEKMLQACQDLRLAEGQVTIEGMQAYFERQLKAAQSYPFCYMLKQFSVQEPPRRQSGKAKKKKAASKKAVQKKRATSKKKKTRPAKSKTKKAAKSSASRSKSKRK